MIASLSACTWSHDADPPEIAVRAPKHRGRLRRSLKAAGAKCVLRLRSTHQAGSAVAKNCDCLQPVSPLPRFYSGYFEDKLMNKLSGLGISAILLAGISTAALAASEAGAGAAGSQTTTGTQTGSQQVGTPATGNVVTGSGQRSTSGPANSGGVGPTGSNQPDGTNPTGKPPSGGGGNK
jgi:hypothetical protein